MSTQSAGRSARVARGQDLDRVVEILVGAFYDDPLWAWAFPDPARRRDQHRALWRLYVDGAARFPTVWLDAEKTATAVWLPPGADELSPEQEAQVEPLLVDLLGTEAAGPVIALGDALVAARPRTVPHFYLTLFGTDPAHRGKGLGLALLGETLGQADRAGLPAYLESSNPANVPLYARYGFVVHAQFAAAPGGPEVTTMWREPR